MAKLTSVNLYRYDPLHWHDMDACFSLIRRGREEYLDKDVERQRFVRFESHKFPHSSYQIVYPIE